MLLVIAGDPCSGKSTAARALKDNGYPVVSMGDRIRELAEENDALPDEPWAVAQELRETFGPHGVATQVTDEIESKHERLGMVVIEGSRNPAEVSFLSGFMNVNSAIVWIESPTEAREDRFSQREGRGGDPEELLARTENERKAGMGEYEDIHDDYLPNDGSIEELEEKILDIAANYRSKIQYPEVYG